MAPAKKPKKPKVDLADRIDAAPEIDEKFRGTDRYLDLVCWNIRWFNRRDRSRVENIVDVLGALNADILVFEEIEAGALDDVASMLTDNGAGLYKTEYGTTGGDQRIAVMYDTAWVRAKDDIHELAERGVVKSEGKDAFPRLPLWGYFNGLPVNVKNESFDFQLVGVHLKSQRGDGVSDAGQRAAAATWLAAWMTQSAADLDSDIIIMGDWNAPPSAAAWEPFAKLEAEKRVLFRGINDEDSISHLMYRTKSEFGSRLDLKVVSATAAMNMRANPAVVRWTSLERVLGGGPSATEIKSYIRTISRNLSDHMPVVSRFYFTPKRSRDTVVPEGALGNAGGRRGRDR